MRLQTTTYEIKSGKVSSPVRIAFVSDLHNSLFGKNQSELKNAIDGAKPDIVIFGGDLADKTQDDLPENSYILVKYLVKRYPCFYTIGNHENARGDSTRIKQQMSDFGVTVLEGNGTVININGNETEICGIYDAHTYDEVNGELVNQLDAVASEKDSKRTRILIAHFPEQIDEYLKGNFDIVLSGHAHGGQWRIPGLIDGFLRPGREYSQNTRQAFICTATPHILSAEGFGSRRH